MSNHISLAATVATLWTAAVACLGAGGNSAPSASPGMGSSPLATAADRLPGGLPAAFLPPFNAATLAHLRELAGRGRAGRLRANVFAKIGDSLFEDIRFLQMLGGDYGDPPLGEQADLWPTIRLYRGPLGQVPGKGTNSLNRESLAARGGWFAAQGLGRLPGELRPEDWDRLERRSPPTPQQLAASPMARELDALRPAVALVLYGANELFNQVPVGIFRQDLEEIVGYLEGRGVIPVLMTIPVFPTCDDTQGKARRVPEFNAAVREISSRRHLPLVDIFAALQPLPDHGINVGEARPPRCQGSYRGTQHPSYCGQNDHDPSLGEMNPHHFTPQCLRFGYNMMSMLSLRMLKRLQATVLASGGAGTGHR